MTRREAETVVLSDDNLAAAASACRDFIERLDLAVQAKPDRAVHSRRAPAGALRSWC